MYAIIETGGKQYKVCQGDEFRVEKLASEVGATVEFDRVLVLNQDGNLKVGTPTVEGVKVYAEVVEHGKGDKVIIFKYKSKKDYRKKQGHRQPYTLVKITSLGTAPAAKAAPKAEAKEAPKAAPKAAPKTEAKVEAKVSASMKKDELVAFAKANNIEVDAKATKAVILETIQAAQK